MAKKESAGAGADQGAAFAKDLGYLGRFFDKLEAHAPQLSADTQERYRTLIAEERTRWDEISGILTGKPAGASSSAGPKPSASPPKAAASADAVKPAGPKPSRRGGAFTVGSLKRRD